MEKLMWFGAGVIIVIVFGNFVPQTEEPSVQQVTQQATKQPTKQEQQEVVEVEDDDSEAAIAEPWEEAVRSAIEAAELAQTAQSADEWTQVESLWTQASELMAQSQIQRVILEPAPLVRTPGSTETRLVSTHQQIEPFVQVQPLNLRLRSKKLLNIVKMLKLQNRRRLLFPQRKL